MKAFGSLTAGFTVTYTAHDADDFSRSWPCSTVKGRGCFSFAPNGDLIDAQGSAARGDGSDWAAFSQDCQTYGKARLAPGSTPNSAMTAVYDRRLGCSSVDEPKEDPAFDGQNSAELA